MSNSTSYKGKMITLEGVDGSGKSSVIDTLEQQIQDFNNEVLVTREPGGTQMGESIRSLLLDANNDEIDAVTETLMIWAARRLHWLHIIQPALAAGVWVLCDRFVDSSIAYQQYGRGVSNQLIDYLHKETLSSFQPDLTLLFVIDPDKSLARLQKQGKYIDRFEREDKHFFTQVCAGYKELAIQEKLRIVEIDASKDQASVTAEANEAMLNFLYLINK